MRAYRYVCSAQDPQWLEERRKVFTASEIAAFFGEGYKSQRAVLAEKVQPTSGMVVEPGSLSWWGLQMERPNMRAFSALSGLRTRPSNAFVVRHGLPFGASLDGLVRAGGRTGIIEMKNVDQYDLSGASNLERWTNGFYGPKPNLPKYRWIQVQAQLYVTGYPFAILCAKIGSCNMVWHRIEPDELFFEDLEAVVKKAQKKLDKMREARKNEIEVLE